MNCVNGFVLKDKFHKYKYSLPLNLISINRDPQIHIFPVMFPSISEKSEDVGEIFRKLM